MFIKELEELIKAAPNKDLPIVAKSIDGDIYKLTSAFLEESQLVIQEGDDITLEDEEEK